MLVHRPAQFLRPLTTAHLAQTMSLLEMTSLELQQYIDNEVNNNPALELTSEIHCAKCGRRLRGSAPCPVCFNPQAASIEKPLIYLSHREDFFRSHGAGFLDDEPSGEEFVAEIPGLAEYVLRQAFTELDKEEQLTAAFILNSLDDDGLCPLPAVEIAVYRRKPLAHVQKVLRIIQHCEPYGVGCCSSQEAMLVQAEILKDSIPVPPYLPKVISLDLNITSHHRYAEIARQLGITRAQAQNAIHFIRENLNPRPASQSTLGERMAAFHNQKGSAQVYYSPDIIISRLNERADTPLIVEIAMPIYGTLRLNPIFRQTTPDVPEEKSAEWKASYERANLLIKCIQQRNNTMVRMMELLTVLQREYILHGDENLRPITRAMLSNLLSVHESTISRAVTDKAIQLPNGHITPLSQFFDRSLQVRTALKQIIEQESRPLSDSMLAKKLTQQGYPVARRTVAKYRSMEGILPAHLRRHSQVQDGKES